MYRLWAVAACVASLLGPSPASAEPSKATMALAQRYADAIHFERQMMSIMDNMLPAMVEQTLKKRGLPMTTELKAAIGRAGAETMRDVSPKMLALLIPVIAETFSEAELQAAVAYYESPAAQSLLAKTPQFTARVTPAMAGLGPVIEAAFQDRLCREIACDAQK